MLETLRRLWAHVAWADLRLLEAIESAAVTPAEAVREYAHILGADAVWLGRLRGTPPGLPVWPELERAALRAQVHELHEAYGAFIGGLDAAALARPVAYTTTDGRPFFALELVRGAPLLDYANARNAARGQLPLSLRQRVRLFCQVCEAMHYAHQRGVVHLDLKPSNILVDTLGRPKILDFGIAAILDASRGAKTGPERAAGTLRYMSPEQARGDVAAISHRSDIYALGLIVYELLTGRRPYQVNRYLPDEARRNICEAPILPPSHVNHAVPTALDECVMRALDRDPQRRHTSAGAFAELVVERVLTQPRDRDDISRFLAQLYNRK